MKPVLLLRDPTQQSASKAILSPIPVVGVPAFKMKAFRVRIPKRIFDFTLITSPQTLKFLKSLPLSKQYVFIGQSTYRASQSVVNLPPEHCRVLQEGHSQKLIQFFKRKSPARIYFPRSAEADPELVRKLRSAGHRVTVAHPYGLQYLAIRRPVLRAIHGRRVAAILLTSPSCFTSLKKSFPLKEMRSWKVAWLVIGPTTRAALRKSGLKVQMASKPSLEALKRLVLKL